MDCGSQIDEGVYFVKLEVGICLYHLCCGGVDAESMCTLKSDGSGCTLLGDVPSQNSLAFRVFFVIQYIMMLKRKPDILQTYLAPISTGNQSDVHQLSATQQVLPSSRNVIMLTNIPELVSSYTIEGLLEIDETSLKACLPLSTLIQDISQDKDLYLLNLFSNTCSTPI